jgi:cytosine deaminase
MVADHKIREHQPRTGRPLLRISSTSPQKDAEDAHTYPPHRREGVKALTGWGKAMDLIVRNARLADRRSHELADIGVANGRIVAIERDLSAEGEVCDAEGRLACPGLIESHIHLDKSRITDRCAPQERTRLSPIKGVAPLKKSMTIEDIRGRAEQTLKQCIMHGATRMRTQVELDPGIGMRGFDAITSLIDDYKWAIEIEICVFPQEGLTNYPGTEELLVEGLKRGAKVLGGAPRYDTDPTAQIERIFALAREFDVDIDMHLDVGETPDAMDIHLVRDLTQKYKRGGRVVVAHMAKLSLLPPNQVTTIARQLANAGIAVTVLPATDLFLMGRDQDHSRVRPENNVKLPLKDLPMGYVDSGGMPRCQ